MANTNIPTNESLEDLLELFESDSGIPKLTEVPLLLEAGFSYIFQWTFYYYYNRGLNNLGKSIVSVY